MELKHEYKYVYGIGLVRVDDKHPERLAEKLDTEATTPDYDYSDYDY